MPKVVNIGSLNVDHVYRVDHFVQPGETMSCDDYARFAGGKGLNQSIALARAGADVSHIGKVGRGDEWLDDLLSDSGVDTAYTEVIDGPSGHAIIQVDASGENSIVIVAGANGQITEADIDRALADCEPGDWLLAQNETSQVAHALKAAKERGLSVAFNPAPMTSAVSDYPLDCVDLFVVNETEALGLPEETNPDAATVLTLGAKGAVYSKGDTRVEQPADRVKPVDTTAAGDTFVGFFLAELTRGSGPAEALKTACRAAAICVTRQGAADSIPRRDELR